MILEDVPEIKEICKNCGKEYYRYKFVWTDVCKVCGFINYITDELMWEKFYREHGHNPIPWESYAPWINEEQKFKDWKNGK